MSPNKGGAKPNRAASMGGGGAAASEASVSSTDESNAASAAAAKLHAAPMCPHVGKAVNIKGVKKTLGVAW